MYAEQGLKSAHTFMLYYQFLLSTLVAKEPKTHVARED